MPTFQITDPQTGQTLRLTGDSPPTEQELEQIFASVPRETMPQPMAQPAQQPTMPAGTPVTGVLEPAATLVTGAIAEPIAGLAGIATLPFGDAEKATENIEAVRQALTFVPRTEAGMRGLQTVAETLQPLAEAVQTAEEAAGEAGFEAAGPVGGAVGETLPTAAMTALGFGPVRRALRLERRLEGPDDPVIDADIQAEGVDIPTQKTSNRISEEVEILRAKHNELKSQFPEQVGEFPEAATIRQVTEAVNLEDNLSSIKNTLEKAGIAYKEQVSATTRTKYLKIDREGDRPLKVRVSDHPANEMRTIHEDIIDIPNAADGKIDTDSVLAQVITKPGLKATTPKISPKEETVSGALKTRSARKALEQAAPTIEGLKQAARGVYKEIDDLGVTINLGSTTRLSRGLINRVEKEGIDPTIHPKSSAALKRVQEASGQQLTIGEIDTLRKIARGAARSTEPEDARLGAIMVDMIDDFLDQSSPQDFVAEAGVNKGVIGAKFKDARQLWRRAKKSELLQDAFEKARLQATGIENGLRVQFRQILGNKKKRKGFTPDEIGAMQQVVMGGPAENIAKALGRFGFTEGQATNMLMGSLGVAGGAAVGGAPGAVAVPLIGQVSRNLAQKMTRKNAELTDLVVRAGSKGQDVVKAYLKSVKPAERNVAELTELLLRPEVSLDALRKAIPKMAPKQRKLVGDAVFFASFIQSQKEEEQ